jgi:G3E family GTPase
VFGDLVQTLNRLWHAREANEIPRFDHVVIETSGLADPAPVIQAFLSDPTLAGLYRIGSVIATVDAVNGPGTLDQHAESVRQVALADRILLTKLDLVEHDPEKWSPVFGQDHAPKEKVVDATTREAELTARLRRLNPAATIERIDAPSFTLASLRAPGFDPDNPQSDPGAWLNVEAYTHDHAHHDHDHHDHHDHDHDHFTHLHDRDIASFAFIREQPIPREALRLLLDALQQNLGPNLLRVKGLINVAEEPGKPAVIQGAQHLLHNLSWLEKWPDADHRSRIVFITQGFDRAEVEDMIAVLDRVAMRTAAARARAQSAEKS